jgi:hypothetical protein
MRKNNTGIKIYAEVTEAFAGFEVGDQFPFGGGVFHGPNGLTLLPEFAFRSEILIKEESPSGRERKK